MSWDGLFFTCFGIKIKIVMAAVPYKLAAEGSNFLNKEVIAKLPILVIPATILSGNLVLTA
jgi:hypothetical protein